MQTNLAVSTTNSIPAGTITVSIPDRFRQTKISREQAITEVRHLGYLVARTIDAVAGCYMRICDAVREFKLSDGEVREALKGCFADSRISEIIRVANSPDAIYHRWKAGFFGFRAALRECRLYNVTPGPRLIAKQKRRAAERLVKLAGAGERIEVLGYYIRIDLKKTIDIQEIAEKL